MKSKFKLLLLLLFTAPAALHAAEYVKKVHRAYVRSQITALDISNKFGTIEINDTGGDSVTVDARVTIKNASENKARQLLDQITINIRKNGGLLEAETIITKNIRIKGIFSIDYTINIPKDRNLTVDNKFGNVVLHVLEGEGRFTVAYGNLTAGDLKLPGNSSVWLDLSYGKADIGSLNRLNGLVQYSKVFIGTAGTMELETRYSDLDIKETDNLQLESKYDDIRLGDISGITSNSKYTNYAIKKLKRNILLDTEYGSVRIDQVNPDFRSVNITNNYGGITIGLGGTAYQLDAECEYCDVKYPDERFKGNRIRDNQKFRVTGTVGNTPSGKNVLIRSRYGEIKLGE